MRLDSELAAGPSGRRIPPEPLLKLIGSLPKDYVAVGQHLFRMLRKHAGLRPSDRVLDVGCGCGRVAWPLTQFLTSGSYDGFDVVPELVAWCRENITPRNPNFRFEHVDVANAHYHESGATRAQQFRFPYADGVFDCIFLTSVFTHMLPDDIGNYGAEIARTLKPGGVTLMTFFILNDESRPVMYRPEARPKFWHRRGRLMVTTRGDPESAVAYPEDMMRAMVHASGLELQQILFGSWCGRKRTVSYQDVVIARKRARQDDWPAAAQDWVKSAALRLTAWLRP